MNESDFKNKTAKFLVGSANWGHESFNSQSEVIAKLLDSAVDVNERKEILDVQLKALIDGYLDVAETLSRYIIFTCLAYKVEGIYKVDLEGMGRNEFRSDVESYDYWVHMHLLKLLPDRKHDSLRSKIKFYLKANEDLGMINRCGFSRAYAISVFVPEFKRLGMEIPEEIFIQAEERDAKKNSTYFYRELKWEVLWRDKAIELGRKPTQEEKDEWRVTFDKENKEYSDKRSKPKTPSDPVWVKLNEQLGGLVKGQSVNLAVFLNSVLDILPTELDPSKEIFKFIHGGTYKFCLISHVPFSSHNKLEIHHLKSRGAATDRRSYNLIPITNAVHTEINTLGFSAVLEKYEVTEEFIISQAIRVDREYVKWLEGRLIVIEEQDIPLGEEN